MNSFNARKSISAGGKNYTVYSLKALGDLSKLPYSLRVLLECLLRTEGQGSVEKKDIDALVNWKAEAEPTKEIAFTPARVLLQDFTGVPCVVDLAAMREAMAKLGGDPAKVNPLQPVEIVIDHSVQVDAFGTPDALKINRDLEFSRNKERYQFLKWGQKALSNFRAVPPNTGIVHQVNLEYLARVVFVNEQTGEAYPDSLVGTDSHTTMINGLGVLGWGVGGIEAEAAMLGQPVSMLIPQVIGFRLSGQLKEGVTATDLVLTVTEMLRKKGVVGKFVEFYGQGLSSLPVADRATLSNMAPEYGATCGFFPVDAETLRYMRMTGRTEDQIALTETYCREQGLFRDDSLPEPVYTDTLELDLGQVEPSVAGPKRPQDRIKLSAVASSYAGPIGDKAKLDNGSIVIAAITSCTNTSNPSVLVAAGLVARNAAKLGLKPKSWVKTSLSPGSRVVTSYLQKAGLLADLEKVGFNVTGYGCMTCIGNSGPLPDEVVKEVREKDLTVVSVLSGNRNFEGRINADVKANYLMSPPLVVAYSLAGSIGIDLYREPLGVGKDGSNIYLKDIWPSNAEVAKVVREAVTSDLFKGNYSDVFKGDDKWAEITASESLCYTWPESTYVKHPPYFEGMGPDLPVLPSLKGLRALAMLGDSVTTDHISPAGNIKFDSPAGKYLVANGVEPAMFNSYGSRRGNHEVMVRGTFANIRLRNQLAPGTEGGFTTYFPTGEVTTIFEASEKYRKDGTPLMVVAGKEYGSGSSRDWAAKGPYLLGVKAVIAESFERIHRSNLVGMGILPLQFQPGQNAESLGLKGDETFEIVAGLDLVGAKVTVKTEKGEFDALCRIDTPQELEYYRNGGILHYVLRKLAGTGE